MRERYAEGQTECGVTQPVADTHTGLGMGGGGVHLGSQLPQTSNVLPQGHCGSTSYPWKPSEVTNCGGKSTYWMGFYLVESWEIITLTVCAHTHTDRIILHTYVQKH